MGVTTGLRAGSGGTGLRAGAGGSGVASGPFDPITAIGWLHAYWTEGPEFQALALADAAAVTNWPDEVSTLDLANASSSMVFDAVNSTFNGKPTLRAAGGANGTQLSATAGGTTAVPFSVVMVAKVDSGAGTNAHLIDSPTSSPRYFIQPSTNTWRYGNTSTIDGALYTLEAAADLHLHVVRFSATSRHDVDGINYALRGSSGTSGFNGISLLCRYATNGMITGDVAFLGVYAGDIFADPDFDAFEAALAEHYNITIEPAAITADAATVIADAWGHWDASDTGSITVTSGNDADQIDDQTGNGHHLVGASGQKPQSGTRTLNGLNVLDFITNDHMTLAGMTLGMTNFTVMAALVRDGGSTGSGIVTFHNGGTNDYDNTNSAEAMASSSSQIISDIHDGNTSATVGQPNGVYAVRKAGTATGSGTIRALAGNGTESMRKFNSTASGTATDMYLGVRRVGGIPTTFFDGAIGEVIVWDRALTDDELRSVGASLAAKWGFAT